MKAVKLVILVSAVGAATVALAQSVPPQQVAQLTSGGAPVTGAGGAVAAPVGAPAAGAAAVPAAGTAAAAGVAAAGIGAAAAVGAAVAAAASQDNKQPQTTTTHH